MTITKTITLYNYSELSEKAKEKARNWFLKHNHDYYWFQSYEDAKQAGLIITSFDIDRKEIDIEFKGSAIETLNYIQENHGKHCDTYKAAEAFEAAIDALPQLPEENHPEYNEIERRLCESNDAIEGDFLTALGKCFD